MANLAIGSVDLSPNKYSSTCSTSNENIEKEFGGIFGDLTFSTNKKTDFEGEIEAFDPIAAQKVYKTTKIKPSISVGTVLQQEEQKPADSFGTLTHLYTTNPFASWKKIS